MVDEVAVFIDFENLRYSLLNIHGLEPDFRTLVEKAKKYGRPSIMRAYADFSEHPDDLRSQLHICGIEAINIPVKRKVYTEGGKEIHRIKNAADMVLALDAMIEAIEADESKKKKTFLLVSGDSDYVKLVTNLRNRFGQRVIICGVPGSIAHDLVESAGEEDAIEIPKIEPADELVLKKGIVAMVKAGPAPLSYWSLTIIDQWCRDARSKITGTAKEKRDATTVLLDENVLVREEFVRPDGRRVTKTTLDVEKARELGYL